MKDRSYLQATVANGRNGVRMRDDEERGGGGDSRGWPVKHQGNEPVKSACGTQQRFASLSDPLPNLHHFYSRHRRLHPPGIHSALLVERFSLVARFVAPLIFREIEARRTWRNRKWSNASQDSSSLSVARLSLVRCRTWYMRLMCARVAWITERIWNRYSFLFWEESDKTPMPPSWHLRLEYATKI